MINEYLIYVTLAVTIVVIPGPAVILTIKNSIKYGFKISIAGILGNFIAMIIMTGLKFRQDGHITLRLLSSSKKKTKVFKLPWVLKPFWPKKKS